MSAPSRSQGRSRSAARSIFLAVRLFALFPCLRTPAPHLISDVPTVKLQNSAGVFRNSAGIFKKTAGVFGNTAGVFKNIAGVLTDSGGTLNVQPVNCCDQRRRVLICGAHPLQIGLGRQRMGKAAATCDRTRPASHVYLWRGKCDQAKKGKARASMEVSEKKRRETRRRVSRRKRKPTP